MIKWFIAVILYAGAEPMMIIQEFDTKQICEDHVKELSKSMDENVKILAPYPQYKCLDATFHKDNK